jgi:hypothetical protein
MKSYFCAKRKEVAAALREGGWPEACDPALHAHVTACADCNDLVLVAQTLQQARRETLRGPQPASPGMLWWRSELRLRSKAVDRMTRPVAITETIALISILLAALGLVAWQWNPIAGWLFSLDDVSTSGTAGWIPILLVASLGTFVLAWGLALFLTTEKD